MRSPTPSCNTAVAVLLAGILAVPASAALRSIEQALELTPAQVTLPGSGGGKTVVRRCTGCPPELLEVTAETVCLVAPGDTVVPLQEFLDAVREAEPARGALLVFFYDPDTRRVKRIRLERAP